MKESLPIKESFHSQLIKSDIERPGSREFYEIIDKNGNSKVIREESFEEIKERYSISTDPVFVANLGEKLFREVETNYNIKAPVDFFVDKNKDGKDVIYCTTDKIKGVDLEKAEKTPEFLKKLEELYISISRYYLDKLNSKEAHLADLNNMSQYMYGKRKDDKEPQIYLVDTDLYLNKGDAFLLHNVKWLILHMPKRFDEAINNIKKILETPLAKDISDRDRLRAEKEIKESLNLLNGTSAINYELDEEGFIPSSLY